MFRPATRLMARPAALRIPRAAAPARRSISTAPPTQKSRSWKSLAARIGIAGTILYYYNTIEVFAEEPEQSVQSRPETDVEVASLPTIEEVAKERERRKAETAAAQRKLENGTQEEGGAAEGGVEQLEEEAGQQGAFNPETGEINWDCPCLGGMADGPCGEQFKAAFSCFVFSTDEPKGMDCIDKFKGMQDCFREYPEVYGAELEGDEEEEEDDVAVDLGRQGSSQAGEATSRERKSLEVEESADAAAREVSPQKKDHSLVPESYRSADGEREQKPVSESERLVPKEAVDATVANERK